jgi:hypothetical protein
MRYRDGMLTIGQISTHQWLWRSEVPVLFLTLSKVFESQDAYPCSLRYMALYCLRDYGIGVSLVFLIDLLIASAIRLPSGTIVNISQNAKKAKKSGKSFGSEYVRFENPAKTSAAQHIHNTE